MGGNKERRGQRLGLAGLVIVFSLTSCRPPPIEAEYIAISAPHTPKPTFTPWPSPPPDLSAPIFLPMGTTSISPERIHPLTSAVRVRRGDTVEQILFFYGLAFEPGRIKILNPHIKNTNRISPGNSLVLPIPKEILNHPFKKIVFPDKTGQNYITQISPVLAENQAPNYGAGYDPNYPYAFFGHTQDNEPEQGPFSHLRQMNLGDKIYLSRTWFGGGNTDWCHGTVEQILNPTTETEQIEILDNNVNSGLFALVTCFTETPDPNDRLIVLVKINSYYSPPPANY